MPRAKKDGHYINLRIEQSIYDRFVEYADRKGQTLTKALEIIIADFLMREEAEDKNRQ